MSDKNKTLEYQELAASILNWKTAWQKMSDANIELHEQIAEQANRIEDLTRWLSDYEEKETACCPEDVGFDEVIAHQAKRIGELEGCQEAATQALQKLAITLGEERDKLAAERERNKLLEERNDDLRKGRAGT